MYLTHSQILKELKGVRYLNLVVIHLPFSTTFFAQNLHNYNVDFLSEVKSHLYAMVYEDLWESANQSKIPMCWTQ